MGERVLTAFKWAIVASLLTGQPWIVVVVACLGLFIVAVTAMVDD